MPNNVTSRVIVRGPEEAIRLFTDTHIQPGPPDFQVVVGVERLDFETVIPFPEHLRRQETGRLLHEWLLENWGTQWNAYSFKWVRQENSEIEFLMDTAYSPPQPIFEELARRFPSLRFNVASFDDGWAFACEGEYTAAYTSYECGDATEELHELVYGYPGKNPKDWSPRD